MFVEAKPGNVAIVAVVALWLAAALPWALQ
jgi:hypothetical protein